MLWLTWWCPSLESEQKNSSPFGIVSEWTQPLCLDVQAVQTLWWHLRQIRGCSAKLLHHSQKSTAKWSNVGPSLCCCGMGAFWMASGAVVSTAPYVPMTEWAAQMLAPFMMSCSSFGETIIMTWRAQASSKMLKNGPYVIFSHSCLVFHFLSSSSYLYHNHHGLNKADSEKVNRRTQGEIKAGNNVG